MIISLFTYSDSELITMICSGNEGKREKALRQLYNDKSIRITVSQYVSNTGGSSQDTDDVFQESIITLDNCLRNNRFGNRSTLKTFLIGICKWTWYSMKRKQKRVNLTDDMNQMDSDDFINPEVLMLDDERVNIVRDLLQKLGGKCKQLLELYQLNYSMQEIADSVGFENMQSSKNAVAKCRNNFKELLMSQSELMLTLKY
jgi:RNA polymerase sigma factor (sigma-70 family)